jgi:hypothetical protein
MRIKINLDTMATVNRFVSDMTKYKGNVYLTDKDRNFVVSAKSMLGAIYTMEWDEVWCESDDDIFQILNKYMEE